MSLALVLHIVGTVFMCGLCWFVQIVHYPLFKYIDPKDFPIYQSRNYITGFITIPMMVIELITALYLLYEYQSEIWIVNIVFIFITGMSTMIYQVPTHIKLKNAPSITLFNKLIKTNWIRTISWTVRTIILAYWLLGHLILT